MLGISVDQNTLGLKRLGIAVIQKAVEDLKHKPTGNDFRDQDLISAKEFLLVENADLTFWCDLAGFNPEAIVENCNLIITKLAKK